MKNSFDFEVCFNDYPVHPYEWSKSESLIDIKLSRVSTHLLREILSYEGNILNFKSKILLISDTKEAVALRLGKDGKILKRSFLSYDKSLDVCEFAFNLKESKLEFKRGSKKVSYPKIQSIEEELKDYIFCRIEKSDDEDFRKYIWYLYSDDVMGYSREELINRVQNAPLDVNMKLYKFLIES